MVCRSKALQLTEPIHERQMVHLDHAVLFTLEALHTLVIRCSIEGGQLMGECLRRVAGHVDGTAAAMRAHGHVRPDAQKAARQEFDVWERTVLPQHGTQKWGTPRMIQGKEALDLALAAVEGKPTAMLAMERGYEGGPPVAQPVITGAMSLVQELVRNIFEGHEIVTFTYRGKPAVLASQIGEAMGYEQGGRGLVSRFTRDWTDEAIENRDWDKVANGDLRDLKTLFGVLNGDSLSAKSGWCPAYGPATLTRPGDEVDSPIVGRPSPRRRNQGMASKTKALKVKRKRAHRTNRANLAGRQKQLRSTLEVLDRLAAEEKAEG